MEFKSLSSDAVLSTSASTGLGSVMMSTNYNANDPPFVNKQELLNYEFANSRKPSESFYHPVECKLSRTPTDQLYTRSGPYAPDADPRLSDLGRFQLSTQGMQGDTAVIGELWITFEIELFVPKVNESSIARVDQFDLGPIDNITLFGNAPPRTEQSNLGGRLFNDGAGGNHYIFPDNVTTGYYRLYWRGKTVNTFAYAWTITPDTAPVNCVQTDVRWTDPTTPTVPTAAVSFDIIVQVTGRGASIRFPTNWVLALTPCVGIFVVERYISSKLIAEPSPGPFSDTSSEMARYKRFLEMEARFAAEPKADEDSSSSSSEEAPKKPKKKKSL